MKKTFKKIAATVMAVATLGVGSTGMTVGAINKSVHLHRATGAPGSDTCTSKKWDFTVSKSTITMSVSNFTKTDSSTHIYLYATVKQENDPVISCLVYNRSGSGTAGDMHTGRAAYASADIKKIKGNISGYVSING